MTANLLRTHPGSAPVIGALERAGVAIDALPRSHERRGIVSGRIRELVAARSGIRRLRRPDPGTEIFVSAGETAERWFARRRPLLIVLRWLLEGKQSEEAQGWGAHGWGAHGSPLNALLSGYFARERASSPPHVTSLHAPQPISATGSPARSTR